MRKRTAGQPKVCVKEYDYKGERIKIQEITYQDGIRYAGDWTHQGNALTSTPYRTIEEACAHAENFISGKFLKEIK